MDFFFIKHTSQHTSRSSSTGISIIRCVSSTGGRGLRERGRKEGGGGEGGRKN